MRTCGNLLDSSSSRAGHGPADHRPGRPQVAAHYSSWDYIAAFELMSEPRDKAAAPALITAFYSQGCAGEPPCPCTLPLPCPCTPATPACHPRLPPPPATFGYYRLAGRTAQGTSSKNSFLNQIPGDVCLRSNRGRRPVHTRRAWSAIVCV